MEDLKINPVDYKAEYEFLLKHIDLARVNSEKVFLENLDPNKTFHENDFSRGFNAGYKAGLNYLELIIKNRLGVK